MNWDQRIWRKKSLEIDTRSVKGIFSGKSFFFIVVAILVSIPCAVNAEDAAKPEPVQIGTFTNKIDTWTLDTPSTVFGFEKFGLRRGAYNLHVTVDGKTADISLDPRTIAKGEDKKDMFAKWEVENELVKIAQLSGSAPLMLTYTAEGDGVVKVQKIELASGASVPSKTKTDNAAAEPGATDTANRETGTTADPIAPENAPSANGNQNGLQYLLSGKTPVDSKDQIYFDMETVTILTIFLVIIVPAYGLMLFSKNNLQTLGNK
jgi:hypothetical protein